MGGGETRDVSHELCALLAGYVNHPNVAGATILSLGCQHAQVSILEEEIHKRNARFDKPLLVFEQQKHASEKEMLENAMIVLNCHLRCHLASHEEVEQTDGIIRVINSVYSSKKTIRKNEMIDGVWVRKDQYLKDEIFEIAKEAGFKAEEMKFDDWLLDWINNPDDELYDSDMEVALYRPIYDLSCSDPIILAPEWW